MRANLRRTLAPLAVEFIHPAPLDPSPQVRAFGCPVRFDAPLCRMLFAREDLLQPLCTSNAILDGMHDRTPSSGWRAWVATASACAHAIA
ncbi:AraC family transcriptional regulator ligand-binding domain-containing protein [Variovorax humicola]|uniref:AraC family transcriptional regulator ligand-binding domain-containing protein n=1 Tax=Variovorax humicola TaxID=1769758 RepID=A0ABU8VTM9_9BURK